MDHLTRKILKEGYNSFADSSPDGRSSGCVFDIIQAVDHCMTVTYDLT